MGFRLGPRGLPLRAVGPRLSFRVVDGLRHRLPQRVVGVFAVLGDGRVSQGLHRVTPRQSLVTQSEALAMSVSLYASARGVLDRTG